MSIFRTADLLSADRFNFLIYNKQQSRMWLLLSAFLSLSLLTACGNSVSSSGSANLPAQGDQQTMAPIGLPPGADNKPLKPGANGTVYAADGLPALRPARGINADMLFAERIKDGDQRFDRLETAVTELRREFDAVKPAIIRLSAVESDMQELLTQLETIVDQPQALQEPLGVEQPRPEASAPTTLAPVTAPLAPQTPPPAAVEKPAVTPSVAAASAGATIVQGFRIGEHQGMTRLVIDLNGATTYSRDLDNAERLLVIELPASAWNIKTTETLKNSPLIQSWAAQSVDGGGSRVIVNLKKGVKIVQENKLKQPDRILMDLQAE